MAKIAIATEDGIHVSAHFGRAPYFQVLTIENGQVTKEEQRAKAFHQGNHHHSDHTHGGPDTHATGMISAVADCSAIIAGGMGKPAFHSIQTSGLTPILTDLREIAQVGQAFAAGNLVNHPERLH
jgi:predicted Fe-Mo cluster-binding NifX family protein